MTDLTRRSVLHGSLALAAARPFAAPHIARAATTTATVWFAQGFVQDEDVALRKAVADYEKASGNQIELSIIPFAPHRQKIISAITSGVVPDMTMSNPNEILQLFAWQDKWLDVSDVVETQQAQFSETALQAAQAYNSVSRKRSFYGVPLRAAAIPCHIWGSLVEKAGLRIEDIPKTWDAYFDFFKKVQDNLRKQGERKVYGLGFQVTANGVDPANLFNAFLIAYGGQDIVTKDGSCISTTRRSGRRPSRRRATSAAPTATATCRRAPSTGTTPTTTTPSTRSSWSWTWTERCRPRSRSRKNTPTGISTTSPARAFRSITRANLCRAWSATPVA